MAASNGQFAAGSSRPRPRDGRAFTLIELLIAIAILGVGITMAAALFPTAIKQNEASANDTIGMIVAKNALAVAKAKLTDSDISSSSLVFLDQYAAGTPVLTEAELTYPVPREPKASFLNDWWKDGPDDRPTALRGAIVLGRQIGSGNDHQLVIVSFAKQDYTSTMQAVRINAPDAGFIQRDKWTELRVTGTKDQKACVQRGGVVIFDYDPAYPTFAGTFAKIRAAQGDGVAALDRRFDDGNMGALNALAIWLIVERPETPPPNVVGGWSPVTSVLVNRTALRD